MKYMITVNGTTYEVEVEAADGSAVAAPRAAAAPAAPVAKPAAAAPVAAAPAAPAPAPAAAGAGEKVSAPMPGTILDILVTPGTSVKEGDVVMILEAMKMQNEMVAPKTGTVSSINVSKGEAVKPGQLLFAVN